MLAPQMVAPASQTIKPPPLGTLLAERYKLLRFLGSGAIGAVYEAATPSDERVAVKVLLELDQSRLAKELATRFLREARVASTLDSKHAVPVIDSGVDAALSIPYAVMPLLSGFDLETLLQRAGSLHPTVASRIIAQACAGLMEAHRKDVIHRDIKPGNIYLDHQPSGVVTARVLDFGMAKLMDTDETITRAGAILGTPHYMSPEQSINAKDVDGRADVWGIAATFYHALTGVPPFNDERSFADLHLALNTRGVPHIQDRAPWIDPGLARVVHGALLRDRDMRCSTVSELRTALLPFLAGSTELSEVMLEPCPAILRRTVAARADRTDMWERSAPSAELPPMSDEPADKLLGKRLGGNYLLLRRLGRGGFGGLYEALGPDANRYAVRALDPKLGGSEPAAGRRFVREARALAAIDDPHVVKLVDAAFDEEQQQPFVVVELLYGLDMQAVIDKHGPMLPREAIRLFIQGAKGLEAAHARSVVHRDVRPANLFLVEEPSGDATVKLTGFGLVKQLAGEEAAHTLTRGGEILGSLMHMSPEQAKNAKVADMRSDVWSLGASLFHALAGEPPWPKELTGSDLLICIGTQQPARLEDKAPWVTAQLAEIVHKALSIKPDERWATVAEMREALEAISDKPTVKLRELGPLPESFRAKAEKARAAAVAKAAAAAAAASAPTPGPVGTHTAGPGGGPPPPGGGAPAALFLGPAPRRCLRFVNHKRPTLAAICGR
jgi:serine/threonine protein kinase